MPIKLSSVHVEAAVLNFDPVAKVARLLCIFRGGVWMRTVEHPIRPC